MAARVGAVAEDRRAADSIASGIALAYYDPARDYQLGTQRAGRDGAAGEARLDLPATLTADIAKALVEARLAQGWRDRRSLSVTLPWAALTVTPGMQVRLTAVAGVDPAAIWRVEAVLVEAMRVTLTLRPAPPAARVAEGESGRAHAQLDRVHGATTIALIDLPPLGATPADSPQVAVVANGVSGGWRRAALIASVDGANWVDVGDTVRPATLGTLRTRCTASDGVVEVALVNDTLVLGDADGAAIAAGVNLAMIARELIQFARAEPLGGTRWRLRGVARGLRGTQPVAHGVGESFVLVDPATLTLLPPALARDGVRVLASGIGDDVNGVAATIASVGAAITPLVPVDLRVASAGEDRRVTWTRRSRVVPAGPVAVLPLGEEREAYRVDVAGRSVEVVEPWFDYTAAMAAADRAAGLTRVEVTVAQIGTWKMSRATTVTVDLTPN